MPGKFVIGTLSQYENVANNVFMLVATHVLVYLTCYMAGVLIECEMKTEMYLGSVNVLELID